MGVSCSVNSPRGFVQATGLPALQESIKFTISSLFRLAPLSSTDSLLAYNYSLRLHKFVGVAGPIELRIDHAAYAH